MADLSEEGHWSRPLRMVPWMPWRRYQYRLDRPLWRRFLFGPCWCITHHPAGCQSTWRRAVIGRSVRSGGIEANRTNPRSGFLGEPQ